MCQVRRARGVLSVEPAAEPGQSAATAVRRRLLDRLPVAARHATCGRAGAGRPDAVYLYGIPVDPPAAEPPCTACPQPTCCRPTPSCTACRTFRSCAAPRTPRSWSSAPQAQGYAALAITDECSLAGAVRAHMAAKDAGLPLIVGSEFTLADGTKLVLLAPIARSYGDLSQLITRGTAQRGEGHVRADADDVAALAPPASRCGCLRPIRAPARSIP